MKCRLCYLCSSSQQFNEKNLKVFLVTAWFLWFLLTSHSYRQRLAFPGHKRASSQLDPVQAVIVSLVGSLGVGEGESDRLGEGRQWLAHSPVGADQSKLERASGVLLQGGAGDVKTLPFDDGAGWGFGGSVVPVMRGQKFHCREEIKIYFQCYKQLLFTVMTLDYKRCCPC